MFRCPGMERIRASFPDEMLCPCGETVEMWPDEFEARCPRCGRAIERAAPPACIEWCAAARECVGERLYEKYMGARGRRSGDGLKERLLGAMRSYFGDDLRRIKHAERVGKFAEELLKKEDGHYGVVMAASILHDVGIPVAERKYGSSEAKYQEEEGPPVARKILEKLGIDRKVIKEACDIIGRHHSPRERETKNFGIVYDADTIVNILEEEWEKRGSMRKIRNTLLTRAGRDMAAWLREGEGKGDDGQIHRG